MRKIFIIFFVLIAFSTIISCGSGNNIKPNIVWLVAEDQSQYFFPFYGDNSVTLPNISQLLENGIVYDGMNSPYPVCAPARSAIITGMYPNSIGTGNQRAYNYNRTVRTDNESILGFPYYSSKLAEQIKPFTQILRENGYYTTNNSKMDYNFKLREDAWDESSKEASWEKRNKDQPFFSVFNFGVTHESQIWLRDKQELKVDPNDLSVPPFFPNDSLTRHALAVNYSNLVEMDKQMGEIIDKLKDQGLYENTYIFFYSDHGGPFPRHKRAIYDTGSKVPLVIKFPKRIKVKEKRNYDLLNFIDFAPTILSIAGLEIPKVYQGIAFLGSKKSKNKRNYSYSASDRFDEVTDKIRAVKTKKYKYIRNYDINKPHALNNYYRTQMALMRHLTALNESNLLSAEQKLWFNVPKNPEEFYDLENDPFELNNLIGEKKYSKEIENLRIQLDNWIDQINDPVNIPEKELVKMLTE
ncbi:MAG: sulfatase [Flavobacteriales bacterium]|jgi:arylsulfatase A-like enzyme|nr:sulfatase [Flavobacteriales bacterium]